MDQLINTVVFFTESTVSNDGGLFTDCLNQDESWQCYRWQQIGGKLEDNTQKEDLILMIMNGKVNLFIQLRLGL